MMVFHLLARIKNYFSSAGLYLSIANFVLILATFKQSYEVNLSAFVIVPLGFLLIILIGWIDFTWVKKHEVAHGNTMNDMKEQLNRIEEKL